MSLEVGIHFAFSGIVNSVIGFSFALLIALGALWAFRVKHSGTRLAVLILPFLKLFYDLFTFGLDDWYATSGVRLFEANTEGASSLLHVGAGLHHLWPTFQVSWSTLESRLMYTIGDVLYQYVGASVALTAVLTILSISVFSVTRFLTSTVRKQKFTNDLRAKGNKPDLNQLNKKLRSEIECRQIDLVIVPRTLETHFSPFASGIGKPTIFIPQSLQELLSDEEFDAVVCHELQHIKRRDALINVFVEGMLMLFWFIPLIRWTANQIRVTIEHLCDEAVFHYEVPPAALASALIKTHENSEQGSKHPAVFQPAFFGKKSFMQRRLLWLGQSKSKFPRILGFRATRFLMWFFVTGSIMTSTLGGPNRMGVTGNGFVAQGVERVLEYFLGPSVE